jgi:hypothetical protein
MCRKCGEIKSVTEFHKSKTSLDNLHSYCKKCAIEGSKKAYRDLNQKEWMSEQSREFATALFRIIDDVKEKYGCISCGENCRACLDFHHIDPKTKDGCVSKLASTKNVTKTINELNKCVVLCANCHRKFHAGLLQFDVSKICVEDIEYWSKIYIDYKKDVIRKKRNTLKNSKNKICKCGKTIWSKSKCCIQCSNTISNKKLRKTVRPPLNQLLQEVKDLGFCATGRKYGVTDGSIRKWIKMYQKYGESF